MMGQPIDRLWVLVAAAFIFMMQAGFLALEVGMVRPREAAVQAMKNAIDWMMASLAFFLVGFGLMFGPTLAGWIGGDLFALRGLAAATGDEPGAMIFFLFQLGFAGTAATIVSGGLAGRVSFNAYLIASFLIAVWIYPVFGHWVWGGALLPGNDGWLARLGYVDFAGSSVVHMLGGSIALTGACMVGPRLGRFGADGTPRPIASSSLGLSMLGVLVLWLGWWGFNGGSTLRFDASVAPIVLNTNLAGAAAGFAGFLHARFAQGRRDLEQKFMGSALGGLVAITASCHVVGPFAAIAIGALAGPIHNLWYEALLRRRIDDPVGAVPVHLGCGAWGVLAVAFFADPSRLEHGRLAQLGVQALGAVACVLWSSGSAWLVFQLLRATIGLRVSPDEERCGPNMAGEVRESGADEAIDPAALRELLGIRPEA
jgi:Amt family ammonium transporter